MRGRPFEPPRRRRLAIGLTAAALVVLYLWRVGDNLPLSRGSSVKEVVAWTGWPEQRLPTLEKPQRRASWGALKQQGAKRLLKENLRADKKYLTCFPSNG